MIYFSQMAVDGFHGIVWFRVRIILRVDPPKALGPGGYSVVMVRWHFITRHYFIISFFRSGYSFYDPRFSPLVILSSWFY